MAGVDLTNYSGMFFKKYGKKILDTFPPPAVIQSKVKVGDVESVGESYNIPISTSHPGGTTYSIARNVYSLETAIEGELKSLSVTPAAHVFRGLVSYAAAAASLGSDTAADNTSGRVALDVRNAARRAIEEDFLYGGDLGGLGIVESTGSTYVILTEASWAGALWTMKKNYKVDFFAAGLAGSPVLQTYITSVVHSARKLNLNSVAGVSATNVIFIKGQCAAGPVFATSYGLTRQLANTSGNLIGLDPATYDVVAGNVIDAGGVRLSFDLLNESVALTQDRGNESNSMVLLCSGKTWGKLNSDIGANRRLDGSYRKNKYEEGVQSITYWTELGEIEIFSHPLIKRGIALCFSWDDLIRPGTTDLAFTRPTGKGGDRLNFSGLMLKDIEDKAGYEFRCYHESSLVDTKPGHGFIITGIDNT